MKYLAAALFLISGFFLGATLTNDEPVADWQVDETGMQIEPRITFSPKPEPSQ